MASPKQIAANRRNAQHSTGPRTDAGKSVSRLNALSTGIYASHEVVLRNEESSDLAEIASEYRERFQPSTPEQRCLVDSLVSEEWLMRRFRRVEAQVLTRYCMIAEVASEALALGFAYEESSTSLERLQRRINSTTRSYLKNLKALNEMQARDAGEIGFDPSNLEEPESNESVAPAVGSAGDLVAGEQAN